jgi:hypothetical protein
MTPIPKPDRLSQLILFREDLPLPPWHALAATTRAEAIRLLAKLLIGAQKSQPHRPLPIRGEGDE